LNPAAARLIPSGIFGLQYWLENYLAGQVVTHEKINEAEAMFKSHFLRSGRI
jgi:hypothetical protein